MSLDFKKSSSEKEIHIKTVNAIQEVEKVPIAAGLGLDHFWLVPRDANGKPKLSGLELFNHVCRYRNSNAAAGTRDGKQVRLVPIEGLDVALYKKLSRVHPANRGRALTWCCHNRYLCQQGSTKVCHEEVDRRLELL